VQIRLVEATETRLVASFGTVPARSLIAFTRAILLAAHFQRRRYMFTTFAQLWKPSFPRTRRSQNAPAREPSSAHRCSEKELLLV